MDQHYVALDVSLQKSAVCILNTSGRVVIEAEVPSEPAALAAFIHTHAPSCVRVGLESGPTSPWLWHCLKAAGLPVVCMDARHAHTALSVRPTKSERDAVSLSCRLALIVAGNHAVARPPRTSTRGQTAAAIP